MSFPQVHGLVFFIASATHQQPLGRSGSPARPPSCGASPLTTACLSPAGHPPPPPVNHHHPHLRASPVGCRSRPSLEIWSSSAKCKMGLKIIQGTKVNFINQRKLVEFIDLIQPDMIGNTTHLTLRLAKSDHCSVQI